MSFNRLVATEMVYMSERLLSGAIEKVLEEVGSPPFPNLEAVEKIRDELRSYIQENEFQLAKVAAQAE
jgi:hypothetical protein